MSREIEDWLRRQARKLSTETAELPNVAKPRSAPKPGRRIPRQRSILIASSGILILGIASGVWLFAAKFGSVKDPFTGHQRSSLSFPLYYPRQLPSTYRIDYGSVSQPDSNVITYTLANTAGDRIFLSEQAKSDQALRSFYGGLTDTTDVTTSLGTAKLGRIASSGAGVGSIIIKDKTWLIINAGGNVPRGDLAFILKHLKE